MRDGRFREDLYYRLAVVPHRRARRCASAREDIPAARRGPVRRVARDLKVPPRSAHRRRRWRGCGATFPGNVRELRNLIERASILARSAVIGAEDLPDLAAPAGAEGDGLGRFVAGLPESLDLRGTLREIEAALIDRALEAAGGVQAEAARHLGLSRSDLGYKIKRTE